MISVKNVLDAIELDGRRKCEISEIFNISHTDIIMKIVNHWEKESVSYECFFGSGYRVYFGENGNDIFILLCGGNKGSQDKDIQRAKAYWQEYLSHDED
jgi:putative addiction module killer protein